MKTLFLLIFVYYFNEVQSNLIHFPAEKRLRNVRQLTFGGYNLNARLSPNGRFIIYVGNYGQYHSDCYQIYRLDLCNPEQPPFRLSSGIGDYLSANFYPDSQQLLLATNFHNYLPIRNTSDFGRCYHSADFKNPLNYFSQAQRVQRYRNFDLFKVNNLGNIKKRLTKKNAYTQAELSKDGKWIAYFNHWNNTKGNQLYFIKEDGSGRSQRLTRTVGMKESPSFSHDSSKIAFHGKNYESKVKNGDPKKSIDIYTVKIKDGSLQKITDLGGQSVTPFFHSNNRQLFFASNYNQEQEKDFEYDIYLVDEDGKNLEKITFNDDGIDIFPTFIANGSRLLWSSSRNSSDEINLFIADFVDKDSTNFKHSLNCPRNDKNLPNSSKNQLKRLKKLDAIHFPGEKHLKNIQQLTFGGQNAEGYFSFDSKSIVFQAAGKDIYGTECDQIYTLRIDQKVDNETHLQRLSSGLGAHTCSYLFPDGKTSIHASTFASVTQSNLLNSCPPKKCQTEQAKTDPLLKKLCNTSYTWDLHPNYDIYKVNEYGNIIKRLTNKYGYDAEGAISPDGNQIVFTSMRTGDPELFLMNANGSNLRQLTNETGYDGGPFFSPNGKKIIFRASRPKGTELTKYKQLLSYDLVEPLAMELYTINIDGSGMRKITSLGGSNWAPFYLNDNKRIVFSTNFNSTGHFGQFDLYVIGENGKGLERLTYNQGGFDAFPMMSPDGKKMIWGSSRNGKSQMDLNLFLADWYN